ncbi:MAG TPA: replicative DNA helicase [Candidatus Eisenbacteria bacterium]|nr:replicative DNA helicase [Candidatus Eisenbacteria bacterium]
MAHNHPKRQPQNLEAEYSVLGGILLDNSAIVSVLEILRPEDFYLESHRRIFRAMGELLERRVPVDLITLSDLLKVRGELEAVGGSSTLASLADTVPTAANISYYARIVKQHSEQRKLIELLGEGIEQAYSGAEDGSTIVGNVMEKWLGLQTGRTRGDHISDLVPICLKEIEKAYESKGRLLGVPTGLSEFENSCGGIFRGDLVVIGGRTSMGKTSFATTIAKNAAERGYPVAFVSAESPPSKIVKRLLSQASGIENVRLQAGILRDQEFRKLMDGASRLAKLPIWFRGGVRSWSTIKAWLRAVKLKEPGLALIIIDYAQLLSAPVEEKKRYLEVSKISSESKGLALELNAAVLLLSQLSREPEKEKGQRPRLSDLRESGSLEQDADIVFLLYRESYYDKTKPKHVAELDVAKNRDGRTARIPIRFHEETLTFSDLDSSEPDTLPPFDFASENGRKGAGR